MLGACPSPAAAVNEPLPSARPAPPARYYWEDFEVGRVREFGRYEVTRAEVLEFAGRFDPQPFHLDDAAAARVAVRAASAASGWHTAAHGDADDVRRATCSKRRALGSPGVEKLSWPAPVYPGDVLGMRNTVLDARPLASRPEVGLVKSRNEVLNQHGQVVLSVEGFGFFRRRDAGGAARLIRVT
jgi:acyl dehydratase